MTLPILLEQLKEIPLEANNHLQTETFSTFQKCLLYFSYNLHQITLCFPENTLGKLIRNYSTHKIKCYHCFRCLYKVLKDHELALDWTFTAHLHAAPKQDECWKRMFSLLPLHMLRLHRLTKNKKKKDEDNLSTTSTDTDCRE